MREGWHVTDLELELPPVVYTELDLFLPIPVGVQTELDLLVPIHIIRSKSAILAALVQSQKEITSETELTLGQNSQKAGLIALSILKFGVKNTRLQLAIPRGDNVKSGLLSLRLAVQTYKEKAAQLLLTIQDRETGKAGRLELTVGPTAKQYNRWFRSWY